MIICAKYKKNWSRTVEATKRTRFSKSRPNDHLYQIWKESILNCRRIFEFWNGHYTRHTFWSCLIRCANMKWIRWVLLKIQSGHDSVHRRTDEQGDTSIPPFQLRWSGGYNKHEHSFLEPWFDMAKWPWKVMVNDCHIKYQSIESQDAYLVQIWLF